MVAEVVEHRSAMQAAVWFLITPAYFSVGDNWSAGADLLYEDRIMQFFSRRAPDVLQ